MTFLDQLEQIDGNLLIGIQHTLNADWLTPIMKVITSFGNYGWFAILICLILIACKKTRRLGIVCAASVLLTFICCTGILKPLVDRARPWEVFSGVNPLIPDPGDASFPSGHASNTMSIAFSLWLNTLDEKKERLHKLGIGLIVFALLIGLSRLYMGVHFPSDVIAGILTALICSQIIYIINRKYSTKNGIINE